MPEKKHAAPSSPPASSRPHTPRHRTQSRERVQAQIAAEAPRDRKRGRKQKTADECTLEGGIGRRLQQVLNERYGGNKAEFARALGLPSGETSVESAVDIMRPWYKGKGMKLAYAVRIAEVSGYSLDWLLAGIGPADRGQRRLEADVEQDIAAHIAVELARAAAAGAFFGDERYSSWRVDGTQALAAAVRWAAEQFRASRERQRTTDLLAIARTLVEAERRDALDGEREDLPPSYDTSARRMAHAGEQIQRALRNLPHPSAGTPPVAARVEVPEPDDDAVVWFRETDDT